MDCTKYLLTKCEVRMGKYLPEIFRDRATRERGLCEKTEDKYKKLNDS